MGYSCTAIANLTLESLQGLIRSGESANCFIDKNGKERFWEIGRENTNGSITGSIFIFTDDDSKGSRTNRLAYPKGSFKINQHGKIERFSGITKAVREKAELHGLCKYLYNLEPR